MVQRRAQVQHVVYYEQVDIVFKPLSLDETVRKIVQGTPCGSGNCARRRVQRGA